MSFRFSKMHGIGNDFVLLDRRLCTTRLDVDLVRQLADRHRGIGCDQLLTVETATLPNAAFRYGIWNRDGSEAAQCGNGVRCVVAWLARAGLIEYGPVSLQSPSGLVTCELLAESQVRVNMGAPKFAPADIPFVAEAEARTYEIYVDDRAVNLGVVSVGNPHAVLWVDNVAQAEVTKLGPLIETHERFPHRVNVGFAQKLSRHHLRLRVFERGVGETLACGTGACAAALIGIIQHELDPNVRVSLPGGDLIIEWAGSDCPVWMTGPTQFVFEGEWHEH